MLASYPFKIITQFSYWLLTFVGLNLGLVPVLHYNPLQMVLEKLGLGYVFMPIHYVVGLAGLIALINLLMSHDHCRCD